MKNVWSSTRACFGGNAWPLILRWSWTSVGRTDDDLAVAGTQYATALPYNRLTHANIEVHGIMRLPLSERWSREQLENVQVLQWHNPAQQVDGALPMVLPPLPDSELPNGFVVSGAGTFASESNNQQVRPTHRDQESQVHANMSTNSIQTGQ